MSISFSQKGSWKKTEKFLQTAKEQRYYDILERCAKEGVVRLMEATPIDSGLTASSWSYKIEKRKNGFELSFTNSNTGGKWAPVAILIQYGHATKSGGFVMGRDYINPALAPIFDEMSKIMWEAMFE